MNNNFVNPLAGFWSDSKFSVARHAVIGGGATFLVGVVSAFMGVDLFHGNVVAASLWTALGSALIRLLTPYTQA